MKNLLIAVLIITAISLSAQSFEEGKRPDFTPDQIAELQTKKMTLQLELTENQQHQILEINKINTAERKQKMEVRKTLCGKGEKLNSGELFKIKNERLDKQIAHQNKMKTILNEQQFEAWKKTRILKKMQLKKRAKRHRKQKRLKAH